MKPRPRVLQPRHRAGNYSMMVGFLMPIFLGFSALSVDASWVQMAASQTQDVADAAAHAALVELRRTGSKSDALSVADHVVASNRVGNGHADLDSILVGNYDPDDQSFEEDETSPNATTALVSRAEGNAVNTMFAKIWGIDSVNVQRSAMASGRSIHVVLVLDITLSFADADFYKAREATVAFLDIMSEHNTPDDQIGMVTFIGPYGVEYTPMFNLHDPGLVSTASTEWSALETVHRASVAGDQDQAERYEPCSFEASNRRSHMPRGYGKKTQNSKGKWRWDVMEHATDHSVGLEMADIMLEEARVDDPFAYQAVVMLTDGRPYKVHATADAVRSDCGYVEDRWRVHTGPMPHAVDDITNAYETLADEMYAANATNIWNVSFVAHNEFMDTSVQGDGQYYQTSSAEDLVPIFEEIANSLPVMLVQ